MIKQEQATFKSVVREYSILYSSRVHQKTKNWADGVLKFYQFNNRVDVFNLDGHLIANDFFNPSRSWRQIEEQYFVEGKEFMLPSGQLLVEIDEFVAEFTREISLRGHTSPSPKQSRNPRLIRTVENRTPHIKIGKKEEPSVKKEKVTVKLEEIDSNSIDINTKKSLRIPRQSSTHFKHMSQCFEPTVRVMGGSRSMSFDQFGVEKT